MSCLFFLSVRPQKTGPVQTSGAKVWRTCSPGRNRRVLSEISQDGQSPSTSWVTKLQCTDYRHNTDKCPRLSSCVTFIKSEVITDYCFKVFLFDNTPLTIPPEIAFSGDILIDPGPFFPSYNFLPLFSFFLLIQLISFCYSMDCSSRFLPPPISSIAPSSRFPISWPLWRHIQDVCPRDRARCVASIYKGCSWRHLINPSLRYYF
jgi:hypothetical protein